MSYEKQIFSKGQVLTADALNKMSEGIASKCSIIDVDKLPQLTGTLLVSNPDTLVEKVIFNTNLSVDETTEILSKLTYSTIPISDTQSFDVYTAYSNSDMSKAITIFKLDEETYEINLIKDISTFSYERIFLNYDTGEENAGWHIKELDINEVGITEALGASVGSENDELLQVISMNNEFTIDVNKNSIYRLKENDEDVILEYKGTAVPNSGAIESIYFNTSLTSDEVLNILNNLTWTNASVLGQSGFEFYPMLAYMNGNYPYALAFKKYTEAIDSHSVGDINIAIVNFATMGTIEFFYGHYNGGWQTFTNPYPINATLLSELSGIPLGTQNDLISSLISTTPFEIEYGTKYTYWAYKSKWDKFNLLIINYDDVPTLGSSNVVKSNGIYTALQTKQNKITVTENDDGSVDITIPTE